MSTRLPRVQVYSAHEYTESNAKFAVTVNPQNQLLKQRQQQVKELRAKVRFAGFLRTDVFEPKPLIDD